ncbi:hypothetical protein ACFLY6_00845 [Candidatus Dependentiae bacterium]
MFSLFIPFLFCFSAFACEKKEEKKSSSQSSELVSIVQQVHYLSTSTLPRKAFTKLKEGEWKWSESNDFSAQLLCNGNEYKVTFCLEALEIVVSRLEKGTKFFFMGRPAFVIGVVDFKLKSNGDLWNCKTWKEIAEHVPEPFRSIVSDAIESYHIVRDVIRKKLLELGHKSAAESIMQWNAPAKHYLDEATRIEDRRGYLVCKYSRDMDQHVALFLLKDFSLSK